MFAIGARPIAVLDSLRFGELSSERSRYLFEGAVAGIGHYGNSIGVPTVGGEVYFEPSYEHNCLVNAMCVGLARTGEMIRSAAAGPGNLLVIMGASTGRDGIGGASVLASAELEAGDDSKRPSVQIGDPFEESKLLECCLELLERGLLVSLQDLGAAGLTSSAGEMASKGDVGIDIDVSRVPLREQDLEPFEVMISESQERMLAVVEPGRLDEVVATCERWQTGSAAIGEVTDSGHLRVLDDGVEVGDVPVSALVDECPLYDLEPEEPGAWMYGNEGSLDEDDPSKVLLALLGAPNVASKRWAFEQYDSVVGSRTARRPEAADAAVLMLPESDRAIAVAIDGNGRRVACDPYAGAVEAVLECAQNLACVGAEPLGLTNCLNFGNPEKPNVAWQLDRAVLGLADACLALRVPVVGGNVSLYNETEQGPIYPTPVVGMVGELPDAGEGSGTGAASGRPARPRWSVRSLAGRLRARQAARRARFRPAAARHRRRGRCAGPGQRPRPRRRRLRPHTMSATAGSPARWPRWRSRRAPGSRRTSIRSSSCAAARARRACSARVPAGSCSRSPRRTLSRVLESGGERGGRGDRASAPPAGIGSRSPPPSGTSRSRSRMPSAPGDRSTAGFDPGRTATDTLVACSGEYLSHAASAVRDASRLQGRRARSVTAAALLAAIVLLLAAAAWRRRTSSTGRAPGRRPSAGRS